MESIRNKWDAMYNPWFTKIIAAVTAFVGTYKLAEIGPLSPTASLMASAVAALFCLWNPGGTAVIYTMVLFISLMHINSVMAGVMVVVILVYCTLGYASISALIITTAMIIAPLPEGVYWGAFVIALYFVYRCKETRACVFYPIFTSLMLITFAKLGTVNILYPDGFSFSNSTAVDMGTFLDTISFDVDSQYIMPHMGLIAKLTVLVMLAAAIIWLVFQNKWLRGKIKNMDICEAVMFAVSIVIIILLDMAVSAVFGVDTGTSYGAAIISVILAFIVTRPFASEKVAETLISRVALNNRRDAALTFVAVKPRADWETPYVDDGLKASIKALDKEKSAGVVIEEAAKGSASYVVDLIARHFEANIIKLDHRVFEKLYGEDKEKSFGKIFIDAAAQGHTVICFNDAEKFFYEVSETSGEYVKRDHKIYMAAIEEIKGYENVHVCLVTEDKAAIDDGLRENGIITAELKYERPADMPQATITPEEKNEADKKQKKKTNRASVIAIALFLLAIGSLLYYLFVYEDRQYDISEVAPVETVLVGNVYSEDGEVYSVNEQVAEIMTSCDATFYYLEEESEGYYAVYRTDEATFNSMSPVKKGTVLKKICKSAESLFNSSYDSLPALPLSDENNTNSVFDGHLKMGACSEQLDSMFNGLEACFTGNELALSCDGMKATKLACFAGNEDTYTMPAYFGIIDGYVTTVNATGDMSWIDFLASVGEVSHVQAYVCATYDASVKYYGCDGFVINRID